MITELDIARRWVLRAALDVASAEAHLADSDLVQLRWQELDRRAVELASMVQARQAAFRRTVTPAVHHVRDGDAGLSSDKA